MQQGIHNKPLGFRGYSGESTGKEYGDFNGNPRSHLRGHIEITLPLTQIQDLDPYTSNALHEALSRE